MEKIVIERTEAKQGFHVRFVSGNGKRTFWCENLTSRANAIKAIKVHGQTFAGLGSTEVQPAPLLASGLALVILDVEFAVISEVEIQEIDSRPKKK